MSRREPIEALQDYAKEPSTHNQQYLQNLIQKIAHMFWHLEKSIEDTEIRAQLVSSARKETDERLSMRGQENEALSHENETLKYENEGLKEALASERKTNQTQDQEITQLKTIIADLQSEIRKLQTPPTGGAHRRLPKGATFFETPTIDEYLSSGKSGQKPPGKPSYRR